jgi:hypothetical protein
MRADMHYDEDRRQTWHWQRRDNVPEGIKATG